MVQSDGLDDLDVLLAALLIPLLGVSCGAEETVGGSLALGVGAAGGADDGDAVERKACPVVFSTWSVCRDSYKTHFVSLDIPTLA